MEFYIHVKTLMEDMGLYLTPKLKEGYLQGYGEILEIVTVECEV